jgi:four helix bundle protein
MESKILSYRDLEVWKNGVKLAKDIYQLTEAFPNHELYALTSQLRRASVSVS